MKYTLSKSALTKTMSTFLSNQSQICCQEPLYKPSKASRLGKSSDGTLKSSDTFGAGSSGQAAITSTLSAKTGMRRVLLIMSETKDYITPSFTTANQPCLRGLFNSLIPRSLLRGC